MTDVLQLRRSDTSGVGGITPAAGEIVVNTDTNKPAIGDGATAGGILVDGNRVNAQSGTTYTILQTDVGKLITFSNASPVAVTLNQVSGTYFPNQSKTNLLNLGDGDVTITPTTSTINGLSSVVLKKYQSAVISSDGTNYLALVSADGSNDSFILGSTEITLGDTVTQVEDLELVDGTLSGTTTLPGSGSLSSSGALTLGSTLWIGYGSSALNTPQFQVAGTTFNTSITQFVRYSADNDSSYIRILKSRGASLGTNTIVNNNDFLGRLNFLGADGSSYQTAAAIQVQVDGTPSSGIIPGRIVFTATDGLGVTNTIMQINGNNKLISFGGSGAGVPALKQSSTELQVRLGNDSGDAPLSAEKITTSDQTLHYTSVSLSDGAGVDTGTLTNAPAAGNPTKWIAIDDNGTTRHIPAW